MMIDDFAYNTDCNPLKRGVLLTKIKIQFVPHSKGINAFDVWLTAHRSSIWNKKPTRCHLVLYLFLPYKLLFISCSTCFGPPCAHLQELTT